MKAIMYHNVRYGSGSYPYFRYLHYENFCRQLDYLALQYDLVSEEHFIESVEKKKSIKKNAVVLTFDDGFVDHYHFVFPELVKRKLWGIFYVPTGIYHTQKVLDVHRIHELLGRYGGSFLLNAVERIISPEMLVQRDIKNYRELTYLTQNNDEATSAFKRIMNYYLAYEWRDQIIDELVNRYLENQVHFNETYMTVDQLREMQQNGIMIGSHGVNHLVYSKLSEPLQRTEITESFEFLENALRPRYPKTFSYPYGQFSCTAYARHTLTEQNCLFAFNVEARDIDQNDLIHHPQSLRRYGCHLLEYGDPHVGLQPPP